MSDEEGDGANVDDMAIINSLINGATSGGVGRLSLPELQM